MNLNKIRHNYFFFFFIFLGKGGKFVILLFDEVLNKIEELWNSLFITLTFIIGLLAFEYKDLSEKNSFLGSDFFK